MFTGDLRSNQLPTLSTHHIMFIREHNNVASDLARINPHWDSDRVFEETRKIISAYFQLIIYDEYVPATISPTAVHDFDLKGETTSYDDTIDATTTTAFVSAAFRFGHSTISEQFVSINAFVLFLL